MTEFNYRKYKMWGIGIGVAIIFILISKIFASSSEPENLKTISVNAPERMHSAFEQTIEELKVDDEYVLEFTNDSDANFVVSEGMNNETENLIAYSPFVAVFNSDAKLYSKLIEKEVFIEIESGEDAGYYDFDFKKVIDEVLSGDSEWKVYCPEKDSDYWDEFYNFLLFTVNDGYYPKSGTYMEETKRVVEHFINSKNVEQISASNYKKIKSVPQNSFYFMPYVEFCDLYQTSSITDVIVMYPKTVVYHSYYASFDETGKIFWDFLDDEGKKFLNKYDKQGYFELARKYFETDRYRSGFGSSRSRGILERYNYNAVEIPRTDVGNLNEEEQYED